VFNSARPRPVHIEIPLDIIVAEAQHLSADAWPLPCRAAADPAAVEKAAAILKQAKRPMIVAGGGAADAAEEIAAIAEKLDAPVFMTINGRGILKPGHALTMTGNLAMQPLRDELAASDAILAIGTEFGETEMYPEPKPLSFGGPLIRIDIDPAQIVTGLRADVPIAADARLAAASLSAALGQARRTGDGAARASAVREAVAAGLWPACRTHGRLMEIIGAALPGAIVAGDQTEPVYAVNQTYQAPQVRSFFNSSTGYGTLGYGLPAAFGAKLGAPHRPSVCLIGDGGLQFSVQELASAVEAGIATAVIIWNNASYGEIKAFMAERDIPQIGVDIFTPDFIGLAKALGCEASRPASLDAFESELKASANRKVPTVIEIRAGSRFAEMLAG
jgi:acetolactate synthase-1/2/3 large subunit